MPPCQGLTREGPKNQSQSLRRPGYVQFPSGLIKSLFLFPLSISLLLISSSEEIRNTLSLSPLSQLQLRSKSLTSPLTLISLRYALFAYVSFYVSIFVFISPDCYDQLKPWASDFFDQLKQTMIFTFWSSNLFIHFQLGRYF